MRRMLDDILRWFVQSKTTQVVPVLEGIATRSGGENRVMIKDLRG